MKGPTYKILGLGIEWPFHRKHFKKAKRADFTVRLSDQVHTPSLKGLKHIRSRYESGRKSISYYSDRKIFWIRLHGQMDFQINPKEGITVFPRNIKRETDIEALLLSHALPMLQSLRGELVIHGTGIKNLKGGCALVIGEKGRGKSTLAAFALKGGRQLLSDDACLCQVTENGVKVFPSFPEVRLEKPLAKKHFSARQMNQALLINKKWRIPLDKGFCAVPSSLRAVFYLSGRKDKTLTVRRLSGRDCFRALIENTFKAQTNDPLRAVEELDQITTLTEKVPVFAVSGYKRMTLLSKLLDLIENPKRLKIE